MMLVDECGVGPLGDPGIFDTISSIVDPVSALVSSAVGIASLFRKPPEVTVRQMEPISPRFFVENPWVMAWISPPAPEAPPAASPQAASPQVVESWWPWLLFLGALLVLKAVRSISQNE